MQGIMHTHPFVPDEYNGMALRPDGECPACDETRARSIEKVRRRRLGLSVQLPDDRRYS